MFKSGISLGAVLTIISWGVAHADASRVTYAVDGELGYGSVQQHNVAGVDLVLNESPYQIQPDTSRMAFRVDSPIGDVWGRFEDFEGSFTIHSHSIDDDMAAIEINAGSLDANAGFIGTLLKSERFFDVENFPSMRFVGTSLEWYKDRHAILKGQLTIKNITKQVAFYVELIDTSGENEDFQHISVTATTTIRRSEFGIHTMLPVVSDNVNLFLSIDAVKKPHSISMR